MRRLIHHVRNWYGRFERPISSISLFGGFAFDIITLKRVDFFWENIWIVAHLVIVGLCIILINLQSPEEMDEKDVTRAHFWYINILQFFFGGLLSTYLVFYFRSATLAVTWPFLFMLAIAFIANERLKKHYARISFQIGLFYLSILSFAVFIVPVFLGEVSTRVFIISGFLSLVTLWLFLRLMGFFTLERFRKSRYGLVMMVSLIFVGTNVLYFFRLIPPIPLSLKDAGVYHLIAPNGEGDYVAEAEDKSWTSYFALHDTIHIVSGSPVYVYSAVFSPGSFHFDVVHQWQYFDVNRYQWVDADRTELPVVGGREGGYRTFSVKEQIAPGQWRVNIETVAGHVIGRLRFDVEEVSAMPKIKFVVKK
jgi:hypothetical protein